MLSTCSERFDWLKLHLNQINQSNQFCNDVLVTFTVFHKTKSRSGSSFILHAVEGFDLLEFSTLAETRLYSRRLSWTLSTKIENEVLNPVGFCSPLGHDGCLQQWDDRCRECHCVKRRRLSECFCFREWQSYYS